MVNIEKRYLAECRVGKSMIIAGGVCSRLEKKFTSGFWIEVKK